MKKKSTIIAFLVCTTAIAQTTGDYATFRKAAGVGDVKSYLTPSNNALLGTNGSGAPAFVLQSAFLTPAQGNAAYSLLGHTHTTSEITDFNTAGDARWSLLGHTHAAADIVSGTIATARLGSGTANSSTFLRGDQTWQTISSGVTDHGALTGLADDDHPQYHNNARGDARYSLLGHTHTFASLTSKPTTLSGYGITGTKAQFNTALTDGDFLFVGDVTQYTDEQAQDAVGGMVDATLVYVDGTPQLKRAPITGDVGVPDGSNAATIANDAVSNAKAANMAQATLKGRAAAAGTGDPTDLTPDQASTVLDLATDPFVRTSAYTPATPQDLDAVLTVGNDGGGQDVVNVRDVFATGAYANNAVQFINNTTTALGANIRTVYLINATVTLPASPQDGLYVDLHANGVVDCFAAGNGKLIEGGASYTIPNGQTARLHYVAGAWYDDNRSGPLMTSGSTTLDALTDVNVPSPNDQDVLTWDAGAMEWIAAPGGGGGINDGDFLSVGLTFPNDGLNLYDTDGDNTMTLMVDEDFTENRELHIDLNDANRTLTLAGDATISGTHSGSSSNTNTGDQTSIVGITGTKAQFNTAVTDGDILYTDAIGSTVQAYDADLTTWAGITPGTGVGTALGVNVGSAGAPVVNGGALGTPSSGTATNLTGLPLSTGVTGDLPLSNLAQASAASKLLGRGDSGAGDFQEISLGSGLSMSGTTLSASGSGAPADATYITQTPNGTLSNEQALGSLSTGIVKVTTTTGVLSTAVAGDFPTLNQNTTGSAATLTTPRTINHVSFDGSANIIANDYDAEVRKYRDLGSPLVAEVMPIFLAQTSRAHSDATIQFSAITLPVATTLTGVVIYTAVSGVFTGDNENSVALYSYSGGTLTQVAISANDPNIWKSTANTYSQIPFTSTYAAAAGTYFIGALFNASGAPGTTPTISGNSVTLLNTASGSPLTTNSAKMFATKSGETAQQASYATSALTAATGGRWFGLY